MDRNKIALAMKSFIYVFSCCATVLCLDSDETKLGGVKRARAVKTAFEPDNTTMVPNYLIFGPESFVTKPKEGKRSTRKQTRMNYTDFFPKMMIFEPDRLFWPFIVEFDAVPPFGMMRYQPTTKRRRTKTSIIQPQLETIQLVDRNKTILAIYPNIIDIFAKLQKKGIKISVAETTPEIATIRHVLHLFDLDYMFEQMAIDLDSPIVHVKEIRNDSKIEFNNLVYFGFNKTALEEINKELNVLTIYVNPDKGLDVMHIYKAIYLYNLRSLISTGKGGPQPTDSTVLPEHLVGGNEPLTEKPTKPKRTRKPKVPGNSTIKPTKRKRKAVTRSSVIR